MIFICFTKLIQLLDKPEIHVENVIISEHLFSMFTKFQYDHFVI